MSASVTVTTGPPAPPVVPDRPSAGTPAKPSALCVATAALVRRTEAGAVAHAWPFPPMAGKAAEAAVAAVPASRPRRVMEGRFLIVVSVLQSFPTPAPAGTTVGTSAARCRV
ncbi:hypothetical protein GCM10010340_35260 [Streptomyces griseoloalbus]|nr:hypothetical protein GCM10010340_35260 [Streptomyces albaduncus]